ncbi:GNAT family N-acetyltransferase [Glutamicibacter endophyticus]|uniref:GNAT family N-acetyltransferase n=1 Tax=Glutamicibacter endophyticus TaxID=1522174 RepID=UPI003AF0179F
MPLRATRNLAELDAELAVPSMADVAEVRRIHEDPRTQQFNPAGPPTPKASEEMLRTWVSDWSVHQLGYHLVRDSRSQALLGVAGLRFNGEYDGERRIANLYYRFAPEAWGRSRATTVARECIEELRLRGNPVLVVALIHEDNRASARVAQRSGLQLHGTVPYRESHRQRWLLALN